MAGSTVSHPGVALWSGGIACETNANDSIDTSMRNQFTYELVFLNANFEYIASYGATMFAN
ncbi:hypothetical protein [Levilactobacillus brevis]|uniref:hypothetical protein n=1 Tax=Levilactobacillus brevis TaxID=1580 RepID=UPI0021A67329|nr:hypothetical protein [Levilactobacillus brevis]